MDNYIGEQVCLEGCFHLTVEEALIQESSVEEFMDINQCLDISINDLRNIVQSECFFSALVGSKYYFRGSGSICGTVEEGSSLKTGYGVTDVSRLVLRDSFRSEAELFLEAGTQRKIVITREFEGENPT